MVTFATTGVSWTTFCHNNHTQRDTNTHHHSIMPGKKKLYNLALMTLFDIHTGLCSSFGFILNSISYAKWKSPHCTAKYLIPAGAQYFSSTAEQKIIYMHLIFFVCVNFLNFLSPLLSSSLVFPLLFLSHFFLPGQHPSPCRRPPLLWQLCQCKLLQSVWSSLGPWRAVPAGLPISYTYVQEPRTTSL